MPWKAVPPECVPHVWDYVNGAAYRSDLELVARESAAYARAALPLDDDGRDAWVLDVDETLLSNTPTSPTTPTTDTGELPFSSPPSVSVRLHLTLSHAHVHKKCQKFSHEIPRFACLASSIDHIALSIPRFGTPYEKG